MENPVAIRYAVDAGSRILNLSWAIGSYWFEEHIARWGTVDSTCNGRSSSAT